MLTALINWILLVLLGVPVLYFALFSLAALCRPAGNSSGRVAGKRPGGEESLAPEAEPAVLHRFAVLIPAYKSDACILETALSASAQDYPRECFRVLVISDSMRADTVDGLRAAGIEVLEVSFENSTKAKSLSRAMAYLGPDAADAVVILDADNLVEPGFLPGLNASFRPGTALQAHRTAKNRDTGVAVIDAASEEINNSVFRRGHNALGLSSALIGSGMAFDYAWFLANADSFCTAGEDKEMELRLLRDGIYVTYLPDVPVLDEKTRTQGNYYNQHRRWTASQYHLLAGAVKQFGAVRDKLGYADKLLQWLFLPRMVLVALVPLMALAMSFIHLGFALAWWGLSVLLAVSMVLAVPRAQRDRRLLRALVRVPLLALMSAANLFRMKGTKDKFIHTEH